MKTIRRMVEAINRFFALRTIKRYKKVFQKYPEGVLSSMQCFRDAYKDYPELRTYVKALYLNIAEKELQLSVDLKPIKKGGDKYYVIVCKDRNLKTVFSLKRHGSDGEIKDIAPSNRHDFVK